MMTECCGKLRETEYCPDCGSILSLRALRNLFGDKGEFAETDLGFAEERIKAAGDDCPEEYMKVHRGVLENSQGRVDAWTHVYCLVMDLEVAHAEAASLDWAAEQRKLSDR